MTSPVANPHVYHAGEWLTIFSVALLWLVFSPTGLFTVQFLVLAIFAVVRDPRGALNLRGLIPAAWLEGSLRWLILAGLVLLSPLALIVYLVQVARQSHNAYAEMGDWFDRVRHLGRTVTKVTLPPPDSPIWPDGARHDVTLPDQPALATAVPPDAAISPLPWIRARRRNMVIAASSGLLGLCLLCSCVSALANGNHPSTTATSGNNKGQGIANHPTLTPHANPTATATAQPTATAQATDTPVPSPTSVPPTATPRPNPTATPPPANIFVQFTSVSACRGCSSHISVKSNNGAQLSVTVYYECSGKDATSQGLTYVLTANPYATWYWTPATKCSGYADAYVHGSWNGQSKDVSYRFYVG